MSSIALADLGLSRSTLFPDLDNLARELKDSSPTIELKTREASP
jgi:hypothetical protein